MTSETTYLISDEDAARAVPFDPSYRLPGKAGSAFVSHVLGLMGGEDSRQRALRASALELRRLTVEVLLANLIVSALHSINPCRPVALSFHKNRYTSLGLSHAAMTLGRDTLFSMGLIEHRHGFYQQGVGKDFRECRRAARIRATAALRDLIDDFGVDRSAVCSRPAHLLKLNRPRTDAGSAPTEVVASEAVLGRINTRIEAAHLAIPEEVWTKLRTPQVGDDPDKDPTRFYQGDQTAKVMRRVFTYTWQQGGRLYGGWWQGLSGIDRKLLTIDGEPTVEIDFQSLHPVLLYRLTGKQLGIDPYVLSPYSRELCKETFQRLLNRAFNRGGADIRRPKDHHPPVGITYAKFLADYRHRLKEVDEYLGKGAGLLLQREDSDLALAIMDELDGLGVTALPIHDSFVVKASDEDALERTMREVFAHRYGVDPKLKTSRS